MSRQSFSFDDFKSAFGHNEPLSDSTGSTDDLVYSTTSGRIKTEKPAVPREKGDGVVRIWKQTSGKKGKGVSLIQGLDLDDAALLALAAKLKKSCGVGGSVKAGDIEIQGDKREQLKALLEKEGFKVKLAGG